MEGGLSPVDWSAPWYAPWREPGERIARRVGEGAAVREALNEPGGAMGVPSFVAQDDLPPGTPYERHIFETRRCPTRDNLHDFFNGLVWRKMPQAKSRLNALQAAEIAERGIATVRGPVRDAITVFDENGALLHAPEPLWQALLARQWRTLFVELRPLWAEASLLVFGHALLEKLVAPRKDMTAHVWRSPAPPWSTDGQPLPDSWLAAQCTASVLSAKPFTPLPVLGVPGWCDGNQNFSFYDDSLVFRPARQPSLKSGN